MRGRLRGQRGLLALAAGAAMSGIVVFGTLVFAPELADRVGGEAKVAVQSGLRTLVAPDELAEVRLGGEGGMRELDACDGTFTEMVSYRIDGVLPLFAAHNFCGGDAILGWEVGQRVRVAGSDAVYRVVDERHTPKWSNVESLVGMAGEFMLQTCYYGQNRMRFLSLSPVDVAQ